MYYIGRTLLGKSEDNFWRCTPRHIYRQLAVHSKFNSTDEDPNRQEKYIDQIL